MEAKTPTKEEQILFDLNIDFETFLKNPSEMCLQMIRAGINSVDCEQEKKIQSIEFGEFLSDVMNEDGETYVNRNPFGIKPGYYTKADLYNKYLQSKNKQP